MKRICIDCNYIGPLIDFGKKEGSKVSSRTRCNSCFKKYCRDNYLEKKGGRIYKAQDVNVWRKTWRKRKMKEDELFRFTHILRSSITNCFKARGLKKNTRTQVILGCSFLEFKIYLESKFEPWMNWNNRGLYNGTLNYGWDIDHIIPLKFAKDVEDIIRLNHYTNLQPLCGYINRNIKRDLFLSPYTCSNLII